MINILRTWEQVSTEWCKLSKDHKSLKKYKHKNPIFRANRSKTDIKLIITWLSSSLSLSSPSSLPSNLRAFSLETQNSHLLSWPFMSTSTLSLNDIYQRPYLLDKPGVFPFILLWTSKQISQACTCKAFESVFWMDPRHQWAVKALQVILMNGNTDA